MAKMDWDRVRKENQSRRYGSEWIGSDAVSLKPGSESRPSPPRNTIPVGTRLGRTTIPGCTCHKLAGFVGLHKKTCPMRKSNWNYDRLQANFSPTLQQFGASIKKVRQSSTLRSFLSILVTRIDADNMIRKEDREQVQKLIHILQDELADTPKKKTEKGPGMNSSTEMSFQKSIQLRLDVYLCAENQMAIQLLQSAARDLRLQLYRFRCSGSMQQSELWGYAGENGKFLPSIPWKAFTEGGIVCLEDVEKAPPDLQFWLKRGLDGLISIGGAKRHPDCVIVLTSRVPLRELWSGQTDHAFIDRLVYVDAQRSARQ